MSKKILIIDDDAGLCELLQSYLASEGFEVEMAHDGAEGADRVLGEDYSLVVLDVMLPTLNGFEVLRRIRQSSQVPVLMLTARGDEIDRIVGLEMGADDYLPKPFNPRELFGPGVPEAQLADIFRPFYRVAQARDRQSGGTGIGLAITERIITLHGGTVTARNLPGTGLEVEIRLPLAGRC